MEFDKNDPRLKLEYPRKWIFKVIGENQTLVEKIIDEIVEGKEFTLNHSQNSKQGKYCSLNLELIVESEEERDLIYTSLNKNENISMVL